MIYYHIKKESFGVKCSREHEWLAILDHRSRGTNCPFCCGKKINIENCLATTNRLLASEWHAIKNGAVTSYSITAGSNKKAWWSCTRNPKHIWGAVVASRNKGA
jgi:hypothetical protein